MILPLRNERKERKSFNRMMSEGPSCLMINTMKPVDSFDPSSSRGMNRRVLVISTPPSPSTLQALIMSIHLVWW